MHVSTILQSSLDALRLCLPATQTTNREYHKVLEYIAFTHFPIEFSFVNWLFTSRFTFSVVFVIKDIKGSFSLVNSKSA